MQNIHPDFGEKRSVHRASLGWMLWLVLCVAPILLVTAVAGIFAINSARTAGSSGNVAGAFGCLAGSGLLLAIVGAACISDFRKWYATRTVELAIYQKGFTYETKGHMESCHWGDIKHIDHKLIEVKTRNSAPRKVSVMRSIVKSDGTVISLAETLNLKKITSLIKNVRE
jgi:hypothetical protein